MDKHMKTDVSELVVPEPPPNNEVKRQALKVIPSTPVLHRSNLDIVLERLEKVRKINEEQYTARCPAHDDKYPSLSIRHENGKILLYCHAGCGCEDIVSAIGLEPKDLFPPKVNKRIEAIYDYVDSEGRLIHQTVRYEGKLFKQRQPNPNNPKEFIWKIKGVSHVLYRLPEVIRAVKDETTVYIVEGEKDVDNLRSLGLIATCCPMGAGKWRDNFSGYLKGANVRIIPDNDEAGLKHAKMVKKSLQNIARSVEITCLPKLENSMPVKDSTDWIKLGRRKRDFEKLPKWVYNEELEKGKETSLTLISAHDLAQMDLPDPKYLVEDLIIEDGTAILSGHMAIGKSWFVTQIAASVATGKKVFDKLECNQGKVVLFGLEDNLRRFRKRLSMSGMGFPKDLYIATIGKNGEPPLLYLKKGGLDQIKELLENPQVSTNDDKPVSLIILDTLTGATGQMSKEGEYAAYTELGLEFRQLTLKYNVAILVTHHKRKDQAGKGSDPFQDILGSVGIGASFDTRIMLSRRRKEINGKLEITGKDIEEKKWGCTFDSEKCMWTIDGDFVDCIEPTPQRQNILDAIRDKRMSVAEIAEAMGNDGSTSKKNINSLIYNMVKDGQVIRVEGDPIKYCLPTTSS